MDVRLLVAIIRREKLEAVQKRLREIGAERVDVSKVEGYGEYHVFFPPDWMVDEVRIEIYTRREETDAIAAAIMETAHTGLAGDGIVAIVPVEKLYLVRTRAEATPGQFWPRSGT